MRRSVKLACIVLLGMGGPLCAEEVPVNQLSKSTSAYLRSAAQQLVSWYEWGEQAFQAAKTQDKPILLDIGAVWCHWCHVIDRESYENPEIAQRINQHFIPIKVDVDARPDIDRRYQEVVQAISGQGGWPLTVFLTPDSEVIYGGTYFPPEDRFGMPGMKSVLTKVAEAYRSDKTKVVAQAKHLHEELQRLTEQNIRSGELSQRLLDRILTELKNNFDEEHGGFGDAPKFPPPAALSFLLRRYAATGERIYLEMVTKTLDGMSRGGMRDQLGGAFHRYSTDRFWRVPHFEVMLYVNAELLSLYAQTYALTQDSRYAQVIEELLAYLKETFLHQEKGGFYGSQDADYSPDDDGDYWTWTLEEAKAVLGPEELKVAARFYGIEVQGEMRENPAKNVLYETLPSESLAKLVGKPDSEARMLLASARGKLLHSRNGRRAPFVDKTIYVNWNGLMISGMLNAYLATGKKEALDFSLKTLERIWREGYRKETGLLHVIQEGKAHTEGFLEDYAYLLHAFLDAHEVTQDALHLDRARQLAKDLEAHFWDKADGGFFDNRLDPGAISILRHRRKPIQDAPTPAGNSMAALGFARLFHITGDARYEEVAKRTLGSFAATAESHGYFAASFGVALEALLSSPTKVVILGKREDEKTKELLQEALTSFRPNTYVSLADPAVALEKLPAPVAELVRNLEQVTEPTAFVCVGTQCSPPQTSPIKLKELLRLHESGKDPL